MTRAYLLSSLAALAFVAGAAQAEPQQPNALLGSPHDRNAPVQINARTLEVREKTKMATYSGNVVLVQGETTLRCKTLVVYYDGDQARSPAAKASTPGQAGNQRIRRIVATGSVVMNQKGQTATGEKAIYEVADDTVQLFPAPGGTVAVTQGPNILQGKSLVVHLDTGLSHVEGARSLIVPSSNKGENQLVPSAPHSKTKARATNPSGLH